MKILFASTHLDIHLDQEHPKPVSFAQELDPFMNVFRLESEVSHGQVESHTTGAKDVVSHQAILELPGNLPDVFQQRVALLSGGYSNTATNLWSVCTILTELLFLQLSHNLEQNQYYRIYFNVHCESFSYASEASSSFWMFYHIYHN